MIASRRCASPTGPSHHSALAVRPARGQLGLHARERVPVRRPVAPELAGQAAHRAATRPGARDARPASRTSVSNSARCSGRPTRPSACHCTPSTNRSSVALDALDRAVRRPRDRAQVAAELARPPGGGRSSRPTSSPPRMPAKREPGSIRTPMRRDVARLGLPVVDRPVGDVGQVLVQRAAAGDVERLEAAADAEDGEPEPVGLLRDAELELVERRLRRAEVRVGLRRRSRRARGRGRRRGRCPRAARRAARPGRAPAAGARPAGRRRARPRACRPSRAPSRAAADRPR